MTRPGSHPLPDAALETMGRLHALHLMLNAQRVGRLYGVSAEYVRQQWRRPPISPPTPTWEAIIQLVSQL